MQQEGRPWLEGVTAAPAAEDPPAAPSRLRPLIFVHDLPPDYNSRLLQYRVHGSLCVHRRSPFGPRPALEMWFAG